MPRTGRPPRAGTRRSDQVRIRLLPEEKAAWREAAREAGFTHADGSPELAEWVRTVANRAARRALHRAGRQSTKPSKEDR